MSRFDGSWSVHEHVFTPAGDYQGRVTQTRRVEARGDGRVRVIQDCEPEARLEGTPMARFVGHHEFDLVSREGLRRYVGPAVLGTGLPLGPTAMLGRGIWPAFGYGFASYAAMASERCQLTGGTFYQANRPVAVIVGHAVPADAETAADAETGSAERADVSRAVWPGDIGARWSGRLRRFDPSGREFDARDAKRIYAAGEFRDVSDGDGPDAGTRVSLEPWAGGFRVERTDLREGPRGVGTAMQYGAALFIDTTAATEDREARSESLELLEPVRRVLVSIRRVFRAQRIDHIELRELMLEQEPA